MGMNLTEVDLDGAVSVFSYFSAYSNKKASGISGAYKKRKTKKTPLKLIRPYNT